MAEMCQTTPRALYLHLSIITAIVMQRMGLKYWPMLLEVGVFLII